MYYVRLIFSFISRRVSRLIFEESKQLLQVAPLSLSAVSAQLKWFLNSLHKSPQLLLLIHMMKSLKEWDRWRLGFSIQEPGENFTSRHESWHESTSEGVVGLHTGWRVNEVIIAYFLNLSAAFHPWLRIFTSHLVMKSSTTQPTSWLLIKPRVHH